MDWLIEIYRASNFDLFSGLLGFAVNLVIVLAFLFKFFPGIYSRSKSVRRFVSRLYKSRELGQSREIKDLICDVQGSLLFTLAKASSLHNKLMASFTINGRIISFVDIKNLIEHYEKIKSSEEINKNQKENLKKIEKGICDIYASGKSAFEKYDTFVTSEIQKTLKTTMDQCRNIFSYIKQSDEFRICLKTYSMKKGGYVKLSCCGKTSNKDSLSPCDNDYSHKENDFSFFLHDYYVRNNIPQSLLDGTYGNNSRIRSLSEIVGIMEAQKIKKKDQLKWLQKNWKRAWLDNHLREWDYYKSTLVIPLTLQNSPLLNLEQRDEFWEIVRECLPVQKIKQGQNGPGSAPFGFICIDSVLLDFFDVPENEYPDQGAFKKSIDLNVGYIMADIFSMILFVHHSYTDLCDLYFYVNKLKSLAASIASGGANAGRGR